MTLAESHELPRDSAALYRTVWSNTVYRRYSPGMLVLDAALEALRPSRGASFVDFGCGTGKPAAELSRRGFNVIGVDFADNCLDDGIDVPLLVADLAKPLALSTEFGFCADVLEHIEPSDVDDVLLNIANVVRKGVFLAISLVDDEFGPKLVGKPLHLSINTADWWVAKLEQVWPRVEVVSKDVNTLAVACFTFPPRFREDVRVEALCNTPHNIIEAYVRANGHRGLPFVEKGEPNDKMVCIVGGGPSLARSLTQLRILRDGGAVVVALNNAAMYLVGHGIRPDWQLIIDSRPQNVDFLYDYPANGYILSAQCHPDLFNHLQEHDVRIFFPALGRDNLADQSKQDRTRELLPPETDRAPLICGAVTSGLQALSVLFAAGFRNFCLFGYDSSDDEDGDTHAYPQTLTNAERKRLDVKLNGRVYRSSFAMYKQAELFPSMAKMLADHGATISVFGDGLLPAIAQDMTQPEFPNRARYHLGAAPASYDFITWLAIAEMARVKAGAEGPLRVAFTMEPDGRFYETPPGVPVPDQKMMLENVMRPALALVGAVEDESAADAGFWHNRYTWRPVCEMFAEGVPVPRFSVPEAYRAEVDQFLYDKYVDQAPLIITLREAKHWPERNSNLAAWVRFAYWACGHREVIIVRDTERADERLGVEGLTCPRASRDLLFRFALYERAACNFFVSNGPSTLAWFGSRPFLMFIPEIEGYPPSTDAWMRKHQGFGRGEQIPWARPDQRIVWARDDYDTICAAWDELRPLIRQGE